MSNSFTNLTPFNIPDASGGIPCLATSTVNVHNAHFIVTGIGFSISVTHTYPDDLDMLLVAPDGVHNLVFWSDAGGGFDLSNTIVFIADTGATLLPDSTQINTATIYRPTNYDNLETPGEFGLSPSFTLNFAAPAGGATFGSA